MGKWESGKAGEGVKGKGEGKQVRDSVRRNLSSTSQALNLYSGVRNLLIRLRTVEGPQGTHAMGGWARIKSSIRSFGHLASNTLVCLTFIVFVLPVLAPATRIPEITTNGSEADVDQMLFQAAV